MEFDLSEDQREIRSVARELLSRRATPARIRTAAENRAEDAELWSEIVELGWPGVAAPEAAGGAGLSLVELCVLLEEHGAALAPTPFLENAAAVLAIAGAGSEEQRGQWLPALMAGEATAAIGGSAGEGELAFAAGPSSADVIVVLDPEGGWIVDASDGVRDLPTIDPLRRYALAPSQGERLPGDLTAAFAEATIAVAAELTGICQRMLDVTVAYVKERRQFGVPVGAFQAVAHRCAEMLMATESARSATYYAAWAAGAAPEKRAEAAALAKYVSSRAAIEVTSSAIQAHGGIGFTWEADVHWWYKRAQLSAQLLGGPTHHRRRLADLVTEEAADAA